MQAEIIKIALPAQTLTGDGEGGQEAVKDTNLIAPGGASSMTLPVDAFAYELLHGARLVEDLFESVAGDVPAALLDRYSVLQFRLAAVGCELKSLIAAAESVWHEEATRAEAGNAP